MKILLHFLKNVSIECVNNNRFIKLENNFTSLKDTLFFLDIAENVLFSTLFTIY